MKISERKMKANVLNARNSTGPKSEAGKMRSKYNALKHGLWASEVVLPNRENREEFDAMYAALREDCKPATMLEEIEVDKIAACRWRLRRAAQCEVGEIRKRLDTVNRRARLEREQKAIDAFQTLTAPRVSLELYRKSGIVNWDIARPDAVQARRELTSTSDGIDLLLRLAGKLHVEIGAFGTLTEETRQDLLQFFCDEFATISKFSAVLTERHDGKLDGPAHLSRMLALRALEAKIRELKKRRVFLKKLERREAEARVASSRLPRGLAADRLLRYQAAIERREYRAIAMLEHLQRQRRRQRNSS